MKISSKEYEFSDRKGIPYTEHNWWKSIHIKTHNWNFGELTKLKRKPKMEKEGWSQ